jgi:hypothetical protein
MRILASLGFSKLERFASRDGHRVGHAALQQKRPENTAKNETHATAACTLPDPSRRHKAKPRFLKSYSREYVFRARC